MKKKYISFTVFTKCPSASPPDTTYQIFAFLEDVNGRTTTQDGRRIIAIGHMSDIGDLKSCGDIEAHLK